MDRRERFVRKRNSIVGDAMAKFEGADAANKFARRQSLYSRSVRQSIPDIRFDEHGVPISTRQLFARSQSIVGVGGSSEQNVRRLSKSFSSDDDEAHAGVKTNFTVPSTTRASLLGSNRRWSIRPDWMANKKRRPSAQEEFIEKNLQNIEILPPSMRRSSSEETDRETPDIERQVLEDIVDESEESEIGSESESETSESDRTGSESSNFLSCLSSGLDDEKSDSECENLDDEIFIAAVENVSEIVAIEEESDKLTNNEQEITHVRRESKSERRRSNAERRGSKSDRRHSKSDRRFRESEDRMPREENPEVEEGLQQRRTSCLPDHHHRHYPYKCAMSLIIGILLVPKTRRQLSLSTGNKSYLSVTVSMCLNLGMKSRRLAYKICYSFLFCQSCSLTWSHFLDLVIFWHGLL